MLLKTLLQPTAYLQLRWKAIGGEAPLPSLKFAFSPLFGATLLV